MSIATHDQQISNSVDFLLRTTEDLQKRVRELEGQIQEAEDRLSELAIGADPETLCEDVTEILRRK